jgi:hypothetical protein
MLTITSTYIAPDEVYLNKTSIKKLLELDIQKDKTWNIEERENFIKLLNNESIDNTNYKIEVKADNMANMIILKCIHYKK